MLKYDHVKVGKTYRLAPSCHQNVRGLRVFVEEIDPARDLPIQARYEDGRGMCYGTADSFVDEQDPRECVLWFADRMEAQLLQNDHKGGWQYDTEEALVDRLKEEFDELREAISDIDGQRELGVLPNERQVSAAIRECADVANFAMMVADKLRNAPRSE